MIEEIQVTKYKVGDKIFDSKEEAECYADKDMKTEERLKELSIDEDIKIPWLLYKDLTDDRISKADPGFKLYIAHNGSDLNFLHIWSESRPYFGEKFFKFFAGSTPCIVAINKFMHKFITVEELIEMGEILSQRHQQYEDGLAKMEKQIAELKQKLGVDQ